MAVKKPSKTSMNNQAAYEKAIDILDRDTKLLFQRLNYFLVATAFLLAAFGAIFTAENSELSIGIALTVAGFGFSILFSCINFLNTKIIWKISVFIRELENTDFQEEAAKKNRPYNKIYRIVKAEMNLKTILLLIPNLLLSVLRLIFRTKKAGSENTADHVYIVPLFFAVIWLVLLILLLLMNFGI